MNPFPSTFAAKTQPLSDSVLSGNYLEDAKLLTGKGYEVHIGLTPEMADRILTMSREPNIREYCPKDSSERFADRASTERWLTRSRAAFLLFKKADNGELSLAGYGWSGTGLNDHVPGGKTTFALRVGEAGQGQGLAAPFSRLIIAATAGLYGARDFWLETWASNGAAVHIYHKIGFETVTEQPGERPSSDGQKIPDTRIYMSLPNELLPPTRA